MVADITGNLFAEEAAAGLRAATAENFTAMNADKFAGLVAGLSGISSNGPGGGRSNVSEDVAPEPQHGR